MSAPSVDDICPALLESHVRERKISNYDPSKKKVTQARISDIKRGKINQFSLDLLARLAARARLHPKLKLVA